MGSAASLNRQYVLDEPGRYETWSFPGYENLLLRGPRPTQATTVCVGASQVFGRKVDRPFPAQLEAVNFGVGGAFPAFFLAKEWIRWIRMHRVMVLHVMAARSANCSAWTLGQTAYGWTNTSSQDNVDGWGDMGEFEDWRALYKSGDVCRTNAIVEEAQRFWVKSMKQLIAAVRLPTVLLWFGKRSPDWRPTHKTFWTFMGKFPHLVTRAMVEELQPNVVDVVTVIDDAYPREYYPSQAGHDAVARALSPVLARI